MLCYLTLAVASSHVPILHAAADMGRTVPTDKTYTASRHEETDATAEYYRLTAAPQDAGACWLIDSSKQQQAHVTATRT